MMQDMEGLHREVPLNWDEVAREAVEKNPESQSFEIGQLLADATLVVLPETRRDDLLRRARAQERLLVLAGRTDCRAQALNRIQTATSREDIGAALDVFLACQCQAKPKPATLEEFLMVSVQEEEAAGDEYAGWADRARRQDDLETEKLLGEIADQEYIHRSALSRLLREKKV